MKLQLLMMKPFEPFPLELRYPLLSNSHPRYVNNLHTILSNNALRLNDAFHDTHCIIGLFFLQCHNKFMQLQLQYLAMS